jgi:hypothetical protein
MVENKLDIAPPYPDLVAVQVAIEDVADFVLSL